MTTDICCCCRQPLRVQERRSTRVPVRRSNIVVVIDVNTRTERGGCRLGSRASERPTNLFHASSDRRGTILGHNDCSSLDEDVRLSPISS